MIDQKMKYTNIQRYLLNYLALVRFVFKNGNLRFLIDEKGFSVLYQHTMDSTISLSLHLNHQKETKEEIRALIFKLQDFVMDCYLLYERNGTPVKLKTLALLCGTNVSAVDGMIQRIEKKIKKSLLAKNITHV